MKPRRIVELPNYSPTEGDCSCGCGKQTDPTLLLKHQAFLWVIQKSLGVPVRHIITGGARCKEKQRRVYTYEVPPHLRIGPKDPVPDSYHMGKDRQDDGGNGHALDGVWEKQVGKKWTPIPISVVANIALASGIFGGVGHREYGEKFLHLDDGPSREW